MTTAHDFTFTSIQGSPLPLKAFAGKAVLVVNTASACGYTPQYVGLEKLWETRGKEGLVVLGVPCNDFGAQEPGTEAQILAFCTARYHVAFPMTAKVHVSGAEAHPFYQWVQEQLGEAGLPKWNFHKYLIGKDGDLLESFGSRVTPDGPDLTRAIDAALKA